MVLQKPYTISAICSPVIIVIIFTVNNDWVEWLCDAVLGLWPICCKFDPGSWHLLGERDSALSLTLAELYGL